MRIAPIIPGNDKGNVTRIKVSNFELLVVPKDRKIGSFAHFCLQKPKFFNVVNSTHLLTSPVKHAHD